MGDWNRAGTVRNDFADLVEHLDESQWAAETLCPSWTPHEVLAHLVWHTELTVPSLLAAMVRARFDFERAADRATRSLATRPRDQLLAELRSRADGKSSIPGAPEDGSIADTAIHTQDVRRALGLAGDLDPETVRTALGFLTSHKNAKYLMDPTVIDGLRLTATDIGWSAGSGPSVEGTGEALMMAMTGRPTLPELSGEGVGTLTARLST